jgi:hypothetical protein
LLPGDRVPIASVAMNCELKDRHAWTGTTPEVPAGWFLEPDRTHRIHGAGHIQHDGIEPEHGARSAARAVELGLVDELSADDAAVVLFAIRYHSLDDVTAIAAADDACVAADDLFMTVNGAIGSASSFALPDPDAALDVLWLLKDADALDRIRLGVFGCCDPSYLRFDHSHKLVGFARDLYSRI